MNVVLQKRAMGKQGWVWKQPEKVGWHLEGQLKIHTAFTKLTLVACEGGMREAGVGRMENSLGSFFHMIRER